MSLFYHVDSKGRRYPIPGPDPIHKQLMRHETKRTGVETCVTRLKEQPQEKS